jgi:hypothetical protein
METSTENTFYRYVPEGSELVGLTDGNIKWDNSSGHNRPVVFIDDQTHGIKGHGNWDIDGFPGENGLILTWDFQANLPQDALVGEFSYALLENKGELWSRRSEIGDTKVFKPFGFFAGDDAGTSSRAPWGLKDGALEPGAPAGELLWDPATMMRRHFKQGWGLFDSRYTYNPYAHRIDVVDLMIYEDLDGLPLQGGSDPYINLIIRDGVGTEHKALGKSGGYITNWTIDDAEEGVLFKLKQDGLLEHYWFYGLQLPDQEAFGVEVRDNDGVLDDWSCLSATAMARF